MVTVPNGTKPKKRSKEKHMTRKDLQTAIRRRERIAQEMRRQIAEAILRDEKRKKVQKMHWELEYYEGHTEILKDLLHPTEPPAVGFIHPDTSDWYDDPPVEIGDDPDEDDEQEEDGE